jgi:hypothetical protein
MEQMTGMLGMTVGQTMYILSGFGILVSFVITEFFLTRSIRASSKILKRLDIVIEDMKAFDSQRYGPGVFRRNQIYGPDRVDIDDGTE